MDVKEAIRRGHTAASRPGSEGEGGNGYGLMLAREYVLEMGGELSFEDRPGGGLAARVRLRAA
jgi:signal transduction histidine kinase